MRPTMHFVKEVEEDGITVRYFVDRLTGGLWRSWDFEMMRKKHEREARIALTTYPPPKPRPKKRDMW